MRKIFREPLFNFMLIGAILFFISAQVNKAKDQTAKQIVIDNNLVARLTAQYQSQMGTLPTKEALDGMIDEKIKEEIYYREAVKLGLDNDDEIIRRRLSQKFEFLENDLNTPPAPIDDSLKTFYNKHQNLFRDSGIVTFTHIYFSIDKEGSEAARQRAEKSFEKLSASNIIRSPESGDVFLLQSDYANITKSDAEQTFGKSPFSDSLFAIPIHRWSHPLQSGYGWHLIFIESRKEATLAPFEYKKSEVLQAWQLWKRNKINEQKYSALKSEYTIVRNYSAEK